MVGCTARITRKEGPEYLPSADDPLSCAVEACRKRRVPGISLCPGHRESHRLKSERQRVEALLEGYCPRCRLERPEPGRRTCGTCRAYHRSRSARLKASGICPRCGKSPPLPGITTCAPCSKRIRAANRKYRRSLQKTPDTPPQGDLGC